MLSEMIFATLLSVTSSVDASTDVTTINNSEYTLDSSKAGKRRNIRIENESIIRISKRRDIRISDTPNTEL